MHIHTLLPLVISVLFTQSLSFTLNPIHNNLGGGGGGEECLTCNKALHYVLFLLSSHTVIHHLIAYNKVDSIRTT